MQSIRLVFAIVSLAGAVCAAEGKWTPQQVLELDPQWLKQQGLEVPPSRLWDPGQGAGLLAAAVSTGGCSASFISENGLIITNHHCLFSILQEHSTPRNDIIANGFLARARGEELPSKTTRVTIPRRFTDVTKDVLAAVPAGAGSLARQRAIEAKEKQLVAGCEKQTSSRCRVAAFDGGLQYVLVDTIELVDIRLVYAPPRAVGEYGGEVDNWMWPRHTGDFSIARAYTAPDGSPAPFRKENVPYRPRFFFPISAKGVAPGDFVMVLGYPGTTYRSLTAEEMAERRDLYYPHRVELLGEWIRILEETTKESKEGTIAVASNLKSRLNAYKNSQGQIDGFRRGNILEKQRAEEEAVVKWAQTQPRYRPALEARRKLADLVAGQRAAYQRDFLLDMISNGAKSLSLATTLVRAAIEKQKPDAEREESYMERDRRRLRDRLEREQKNYFAPADKALLASFVKRALALPPNQRIEAIDRSFTGRADAIERLYAATKVLALEERLKMLDETPGQLRGRKDPLIDLAFALDTELRALKERTDRRQGAISELRPLWRAAVIAHAGRPVSPDANGTLRVSFAHVKGYEPRDGVIYKPQTTLSGVLEKHTGEEPFNVPPKIAAAARDRRFGSWKDERLNDVPVGFLADVDTTGGNSGSAVLNGRGELVGLNFDRVWENVANDFGYNPAVARNVNVDIRYLLWILDQVDDAGELLRELGVRR